jgi:hypothetical protein
MRRKVLIIKAQWIYMAAVAVLFTVSVIFFVNVLIGQAGKSVVAKPPAPQTKKFSILIDTDEKRLYLLCNGKLYKTYRCAVGKKETPSPLGSYLVIQRSHWGEGFGGYWLGINCPWGNFGIHGTTKPETVGTSASHGCFRMYNRDIAQLYSFVRCGTIVCVTGGNFGAFGCGFRTILPGMSGLDVQVVQKRLKQMGYYSGPCNGLYDERLTKAIHRFQLKHKLEVSDTVGRQMISALGFVMMD